MPALVDALRRRIDAEQPDLAISDFEPSKESYAPSVEVIEMFRTALARIGVTAEADVDLCVAIVGGLVDAQLLLTKKD